MGKVPVLTTQPPKTPRIFKHSLCFSPTFESRHALTVASSIHTHNDNTFQHVQRNQAHLKSVQRKKQARFSIQHTRVPVHTAYTVFNTVAKSQMAPPFLQCALLLVRKWSRRQWMNGGAIWDSPHSFTTSLHCAARNKLITHTYQCNNRIFLHSWTLWISVFAFVILLQKVMPKF